MIEAGVFVAAVASALASVLVVRWLAPPPARLASRVRPYGSNRVARTSIPSQTPVGSALLVLVRFALAPIARRTGRLLDRDGGATTGLRLRSSADVGSEHG